MALTKDKKKSLSGVLAGINKKFGVGAVNFVADIEEELRIKFYKTPSHEVNTMLGGGMGKGKIIELFGESGSGKTSLAMETIAHNQKKDPDFVAGWFETEESWDPEYAKSFGIDLDRCVYWDQSETGAEQGFDILRSLVSSGQFNMIVVNSVAGLAPKKEMEDEMDKQNIALTARLMSKFMRVITGTASKAGTTLVFINQVRTNVGQMFGNPNTTTGGKALAFYASQRIGMNKNKLQASDPIKEDVGIKVSCRVAKNRLAKGNPYVHCFYYAIYGEGIDSVSEMPDILENSGILRKSGSWYYYEDENSKPITIGGAEGKWRSKTVLVDFLKANEEARNEFEAILDKELSVGKIKAKSLDADEINKIEQLNKELEEEFLDDSEVVEEPIGA